jgi:hypothetical protein
MHPNRALIFVLVVLATLALLPAPASSDLLVRAGGDGERITVGWSWYEYAGCPTGDPAWTGYDLYRRSAEDCGAWVRVNPEPFHRTMGVSESFTFVDTPPAPQAYEYEVMLVKDDRTQAPYPDYRECGFWCCTQRAFAGCPVASVPVAHGLLVDWGWTLAVERCSGTCFTSAYLVADGAHRQILEAMVPYIGSEVRIYGTVGCGSIEGCSIGVSRFDVVPCSEVTEAGHTSWGRVKTIYR